MKIEHVGRNEKLLCPAGVKASQGAALAGAEGAGLEFESGLEGDEFAGICFHLADTADFNLKGV